MATKPKTTEPIKTTAVAAPSTTSLASLSAGGLTAHLGQSLLDQLGQAAKDTAATERPSTASFSTKSGVFSYDGQALPNNEIEVVILAKAWENTYYDKPFNANNITSPRCFALTLVDPTAETMVPNPVNDVIAPTCEECPLHQWGSDSKGGRGKECKEKRRLILMPAVALNNVDDVKAAEMGTLGIPVMSVANFSNYTNMIAAQAGLPLYAVTTLVKVVPDPRSQFRVTFTGVNAITDPDVLSAVMGRIQEAERLAMVPYSAATEGEEAPAVPAKTAKFAAKK